MTFVSFLLLLLLLLLASLRPRERLRSDRLPTSAARGARMTSPGAATATSAESRERERDVMERREDARGRDARDGRSDRRNRAESCKGGGFVSLNWYCF